MAEYNLGKVVGTDGNGIVTIAKTGTEDNVDTYTIEFSNGSTTTFTVTNGRDGEGVDIVTAWESTLSDSKVASEKLVKDSLDGKQAILVSGTNIKTVNNNSLLGSGNIDIQGGGGVDIVTSWGSTLSDSKVPSEKLTKDTIDLKVNTADIANNLTTTSAGKVLDARQGKALADLIGNAINYINQ